MKSEKKNLRKIYKEKREKLFHSGEIDKISGIICAKLDKYIKDAKNILIYYPFESELNILKILENPDFKDKNFYLPVCSNDKILVCPYKTGDELILNKYKIYEPKTEPISDVGILDIVITPALCADKNCNRLGYGGGYYDRFFKEKNLHAKKIVIIADEMLADTLPTEEFDIKCDIVLTETIEIKQGS